jgi:hypothetical protein
MALIGPALGLLAACDAGLPSDTVCLPVDHSHPLSDFLIQCVAALSRRRLLNGPATRASVHFIDRRSAEPICFLTEGSSSHQLSD